MLPGTKSLYHFFGKGMARKGIVTVIIDYRLSQLTTYEGMANDGAKAIKWVKQNISIYDGDTGKIFISGHSAGGHLASLISTDNRYFDSINISNPIKGTILIDAFGMDIYDYLKTSKDPNDTIFIPAFTSDPETWKMASSINYLRKEMPEFLLLLGGSTKTKIIKDNQIFLDALKKFQPDARMIVEKGKKHVGMITQFLNPFSKSYSEIIVFMNK